MNQFDKEIKKMIGQENIHIPDAVHDKIEQTLASLPENKTLQRSPKHNRMTVLKTALTTAACFMFVFLFLLPNASVVYAQAVEDIPVIGKLVQVVTLRNYYYSDKKHELDATIPLIQNSDTPQASELINKDIGDLTESVINRFYKEIDMSDGKGYGSIYIGYETVTNTPEWFTLKLSVEETAASTDSYSRFYHIDRTGGKYVTFGDLFDVTAFEAFEQIVIAKMAEAMKSGDNIIYWIDEANPGKSTAVPIETQNFYFTEDYDLVIVYDKYAVAPGSMGCPEFEISREEYLKYLSPEYAEIFTNLPQK